MKKFSYYLYDSYESTEVMKYSDDPRNFLDSNADSVINTVINTPLGECNYKLLCKMYSVELIDILIRGGLIRKHNDTIYLDSTIIFQEDLKILESFSQKYILHMAEKLEQHKSKFHEITAQFDNGFSVKVNLYHILCGYIFDGSVFEFLREKEILSTSRPHESGLDYLIIGYEQTTELDVFSKQLLCSYNRFTDKNCVLQSFGDANGNRKDFFRFSKQLTHNTVPSDLADIELIWKNTISKEGNSVLFDEVKKSIMGNKCSPLYNKLLTEFGYIKKNSICVPVYSRKDIKIINSIKNLVESVLYEEMLNALVEMSVNSNLVCCMHDVSSKEIANELYHILFGQLNEELVRRNFVCKPNYFENQGRYLNSIMLM